MALSIYRRPPGDGPPATKKRKLRETDEALLERRFIKEDDAFAFALVASPLVENTDPGLLRALFSCIVPHRRLQRRVAEELVRQAQHPDLVRHVRDDLEGTFTPPAQLSDSLSAVPLQTHEDDPSNFRESGSGGGPSVGTREVEGSMPPPGGSRGGDRSSGGGGQQSSGASRMGAGGQLAKESAVDKDDDAASSPLLAATSPLSHSSPATPPSSASSVKVSDAQVPQQCDLQHGGLGRLDYLAVSSPPLQVDYLPAQYRPAPAKPTRWIRSDQSQTDASTVPEPAWTELAVIEKLPSSSEYRVVVAKSIEADTELVIKEEFLRYTDNDPMHTLRNEAATYDALAAAGLGSICAPYVGLYKVVDRKSKLALVTERWGEPLDDFNNLSEDERTALGEMVLNLHNRGFYHGDFAARNVLVDSARKFRLIDWESSYRNHACPGHRRCAEVAEALKHLDLVVNDPPEKAA
ncbi:hypothetical protein JCM10296v2_000137 [Rhodotorula toruloides]